MGTEEILLEMNGPPVPAYGTVQHRTELSEDGYTMRAPGSDFGHAHPNHTGSGFEYAHNGSFNVRLYSGDQFEVVADDGDPFTAIRVDLAELADVAPIEKSNYLGGTQRGRYVREPDFCD